MSIELFHDPSANKNYFYYQDWWKKTSEIFKQNAGNRCEFCGNGNGLTAHHTNYMYLQREHRWDIIVLCKSCHMVLHLMLCNSVRNPSDYKDSNENLINWRRVLIRFKDLFIREKSNIADLGKLLTETVLIKCHITGKGT